MLIQFASSLKPNFVGFFTTMGLNSMFLLIIGLSSFQFNALGQVQIGDNIIGESFGDQFGYSVSMPDVNTLAIGGPTNNGNGTNSGHVRVYRMSNNFWSQKGGEIDGSVAGDFSGFSISMPDNNTIAIGAPNHFGPSVGSFAGQVRIFNWNGFTWVQKGADIIGEATGDVAGFSVSMSDLNNIAVGATGNDQNGSLSGHVRVFQWNGVNWLQKGNDIDGDAAGDQLGYSVSLADSNTIAIGAPFSDSNGFNSGQVKVYEWSGNAWIKKGSNIPGASVDDLFGLVVSMPDMNTIGVGTPGRDVTGTNAGQVSIYEWDGSDWTQKGNSINGDMAFDRFGESISMPDPNTIAIGSPYHDQPDSSAGQVKVFKWNGNSWIQNTNDINGPFNNFGLGWAVSMSDSNNLAIGSPSGASSGLAQVFSLCNTTDTISITACESYMSPSGNFIWTSSGFYNDIIPNAAGCDSLIYFNLTIVQNDVITTSPWVCRQYTSPSGSNVWTSSGQYTDTLTNRVGCDSIILINLTVDTVNTKVSISGNSLIADATTALSYQWFDCNNSFTAIPGANNRAFIPPDMNTSYAVVIETTNCIDTSECVSITNLADYKKDPGLITIYPNPSEGIFQIKYTVQNTSRGFTITDIRGKIVFEGIITKEQLELDLSVLRNGVYILKIEDSAAKLVIE